MYQLTIPTRSTTTHASMEDAQRFYTMTRNRSGEGASTFPFGTLIALNTAAVYQVSYNARIWAGDQLVMEAAHV
jgi:hypothetical protein